MTRSKILLAATVALLTACGPKGPDADDTPATPTNEAQRAAAVALAMRAEPTKRDSILAAHGYTEAQLEAAVYRIAADSALNAEYLRLTAP